MILNGPQLATVRSQYGWLRPPYLLSMPSNPDRNFTYKDGNPGWINGICNLLPQGADIVPVNAEIGSIQDFNCQSVSKYTPPTTAAFLTVVGPAVGSVAQTIEHDMQILGMGGHPIDFYGTAAQFVFGSFSYWYWEHTEPSAGVRELTINYKTPRGGSVECYWYEHGDDGVVDVQFVTGAPYAVNAFRNSGGVYAALAKGGLLIPPGIGSVKLRITWASGLAVTQTLAKFRFNIEMPYGI